MASNESARRLGLVFDLAAEDYESFRSGYPQSIVDRAIELGNLGMGSRVLEVGSGTGKLTKLLVDRGLTVDAIDPGPNMIAVAQRRFGETEAVSFHQGRFEDVDLAEREFDAVFSATAFHWVDPVVGWVKAAAHLKVGGLLALLAHVNVRDEKSGPVQDEFFELLREHSPDTAAGWRPSVEFDALLAGVPDRRSNVSEVWDWLMWSGLTRPGLALPEAAPLFEDVAVAGEPYSSEETADELLARFRTTSLFHMIDASRRAAFEDGHRRLVERRGGTVRTSGAVLLMTARRSTCRV